jgi:hypothetical protein
MLQIFGCNEQPDFVMQHTTNCRKGRSDAANVASVSNALYSGNPLARRFGNDR